MLQNEGTLLRTAPELASDYILRSNIYPERYILYIRSSTESSNKNFDGSIKSLVVKAQNDRNNEPVCLDQRIMHSNDLIGVIISENIGKENIAKYLFAVKSQASTADLPIVLAVNSKKINHDTAKLKYQFDDIIHHESVCYKSCMDKFHFLKKVKKKASSDTDLNQDIKLDSILHKYDRAVSRLLDIIISATALIILLPIFIIIAIIIKIESKGPIFYSAYRAGSGYKIFKFYKFRSMVNNADNKLDLLKSENQYSDIQNGGPTFFKIANDPRITKFGSFLRNTSLDELPQLFNVLKGDMSLVGNRPLPLYEAKTLTTDDCVERFLAPAGITGLWQVQKRGKPDMSVTERVNLDISYSRNQSLWHDIKIIWKTPFSIIQKEKV